jgi:hypothetical protein
MRRNYILHKGRLKQRASSVTATTRTSFRYSKSTTSQSVKSVSLISKERQWLSHRHTRIPASSVGDLQIAIHYLDTTRMTMCAVHTIVPITGTDVHLPIIQPHYRRQKVNFPPKTAKADEVTQRTMCLKPGNNTKETGVFHFRFPYIVLHHIFNKCNSSIICIFSRLLTLYNRLRVKQIYSPPACQLFQQHCCARIQVQQLVHITVLNECQQN